MYPTLKHGDRLLLLKHYPTRWLQTGQIVAGYASFQETPSSFPKQSLSEFIFIKRLVGLPGTKVSIHISEIDELRRDFLLKQCNNEGKLIWDIPMGHCFVRGEDSTCIDSIVWGPIPLKKLVGIVCLRLPQRID